MVLTTILSQYCHLLWFQIFLGFITYYGCSLQFDSYRYFPGTAHYWYILLSIRHQLIWHWCVPFKKQTDSNTTAYYICRKVYRTCL